MSQRFVCIHGHFYQPPRENAWLEAVELQDSAYPFHDWNERITAEGYAPNTASRILDGERRIIDIVNNYSKISFNLGPTLLSWLETEEPQVYEAILEADKLSQEKFSGHGSALAQVYNHMIMPLANKRDKTTQVYWGVKDFEYRFGRKPEGMWLPETAADLETLEVLAEHEIEFTILSPYQAGRTRKKGEKEWTDVTGGKVDPKRPYLCQLPSGKSIVLFFYDGPISQELGFGTLLNNGENFANRLVGTFSEEDEPQIVHIATDGETYGHHRRNGDMALAYCLYHIESNELTEISIYGEYLEKFPPTHEVEIIENTSWSCAHGVERWRSDCGCNSGMRGDWNQAWRAPLREALNWLREELADVYEKHTKALLKNPWTARNEYIIPLLDRSGENVDKFLSKYSTHQLSKDEKIQTLKLLELQRHAMLMYTSCGWFFDEISGIETTQILQYAARAMQLMEEISGNTLESQFIQKLESAPSNISEFKNGGNVYERFIQPARLNLLRVGSHYAISSLFEEYPETIKLYAYEAKSDAFNKMKAGKLELAIGRAKIRSTITWDESEISFAALYLGGHILNGGLREYMGEVEFNQMHQEVKAAFLRSDIAEVIRLMDDNFGTHNYSLWHLFKDEQRKVFDQILETTLDNIQVHYRQIYENDYALLRAMQEMKIPIPATLSTPVQYILNSDLQNILEDEPIHLERLQHLIEEIDRLNIKVDKTNLAFVANRRITEMMKNFEKEPENEELIEEIKNLLRILEAVELELDIWEAQNIYFFTGKRKYEEFQQKAEKGKKGANEWITQFDELGNYLRVRIS